MSLGFRFRQKKADPNGTAFLKTLHRLLTLACFKTWLCFVDHIDTAFTAYHTTIAVAALKRAKRVFDLHGLLLQNRAADSQSKQNGGHDWDRTSDPFDVNEVLYR